MFGIITAISMLISSLVEAAKLILKFKSNKPKQQDKECDK